MEAYYNIYNQDCFEKLKDIPDNSIDLILTDPPYNISQYSTGNIHFPNRKSLNNDLAEWDDIKLEPSKLLADFKRILKPTGNIFIFTSYNLLGEWYKSFDSEFETFQYMIWHKTNPSPSIHRVGFLNSCEMIACLWNKEHTWNITNQKELDNLIESPICMGKERLKNPVHPTQKPLKILKHLLKIASNEGDTVLDPFMGVGSTGVAALEMNRNFVGMEIDESYFTATQERFKDIQIEFNF